MWHSPYKFGCGHSINKDTWKIKITFGGVSASMRVFYGNFTPPIMYACATVGVCVCVCLVAIAHKLEGHFTLRTKYLFGCISASVEKGFSGYFMFCTFRAWAKRMVEFGCVRSKIEGTLLGEPFTFSTVPRQQLEEFVWNIESRPFPRMRHTSCTSISTTPVALSPSVAVAASLYLYASSAHPEFCTCLSLYCVHKARDCFSAVLWPIIAYRMKRISCAAI